MIRRTEWVAVALLLGVMTFAYRGVVHNGFVLDDFNILVNNRSLDSFSGVLARLSYRPVLMASYALERMLWGDSAAGHHLGNLLVHGAVVVLTAVLARRLGHDHVAAVVAAAIVALHPINSEAVNYIAARSSTLMTVGILVAVWCYDHAWRGTNRAARAGWLAGSVVAALAAIGAKEAGVVLPLLIICWDRAVDPTRPWRTTLSRSGLLWSVIVLLLAIRVWMTGAVVGITPVGSAVQAIVFDAKIMLVSLGHWWWPVNLALDYAWPNVIPTGEAILWIVGAVAAGLGTWGLVRRGLQVGWCLVWFWASLLPIAVLPFMTRLALYQEHRSYLGGIALAWAVGRLFMPLYRIAVPHRMSRLILSMAVGVLAVAAARADALRTAVWVDPQHVWEDTLRQYPGSAFGHSSRGLQLYHSGDLNGAQAEFEYALSLDGSLAATHGYLGMVYAQTGRPEQGIAELTLAQAMAPSNRIVRMNLGKAYESMGRPDEALEVYDRLLREYPTHAPALGRTAVILERAGRLADAANRYRLVIDLDPSDDAAYETLGAVLLRLERWGEAEDVFAVLASRHPDSGASWFNLGMARERVGRDQEALDAFGRAAEFAPRDPDPEFRIGMILARRGTWDAAAAAYERAIVRDPDHALSHFNLAIGAERYGDRARAVRHYRAARRASESHGQGTDVGHLADAALARLGDG